MASLREMNGSVAHGSALLCQEMSMPIVEHEVVLRQKYERALKELDYTKKLLQNQQENEAEQFMAVKKQLEKKVYLGSRMVKEGKGKRGVPASK